MAKGKSYDEDFKKMIVELYNNKKPASEIVREYGISNSVLYKWIKDYSPIKTEDGTITNNKEIQKLKKELSKIKYITYEQFKEFIKNVDNIGWKTFFIFLYYTGMRKGKVQALTWEDIDFNNNEINVSKNLTNKVFNAPYKITNTKTKENRKVDMDSFLRKTMLDYYDVKSKKSDFSKSDFVFGSKKPLARTTIDRYKKYYFSKCSVPEITIHEFRHSHATMLYKEKIDFKSIQERLGHASISTTLNTYVHTDEKEEKKLIKKINFTRI